VLEGRGVYMRRENKPNLDLFKEPIFFLGAGKLADTYQSRPAYNYNNLYQTSFFQANPF